MLIAHALAALLTIPAADATAGTATAVLKPAEAPKPPKFPLSGSVSLTNVAGSGTFAPPPLQGYWNPSIGTALTLSPSAKLAKDWSLSLTQTIGVEWTQGDGVTYNNQIDLGDVAARVAYTGLKWEDLNLSLSLSGGYTLPLSLASRAAGSVGPVGVGSRLTWNHAPSGWMAYGGLRMGYNLTLPQLAARYANVPGRPVEASNGELLPTVGCIVRNQDELDNFGCAGGQLASGFSTGVTVGGGYTPSILDGKLSFALELGYNAGFSPYVIWERDDLTAEDAVTGPVARQSTSGNLSASYQAMDWLVLTAGAQSGQPMFGSDTVTPRFPLWDFVSPANNFSSLYLDANFSF